MVFITLRVSGPDLDVDRVLPQAASTISGVWRKGDASPTGRGRDDSGFNLSLPDADSWQDALPAVQAWFRSEAGWFDELRCLSATVDLDIGVTVGADASFAPTVSFPAGFLADLLRSGVSLSVSAYPTSGQAPSTRGSSDSQPEGDPGPTPV